MTPDAARVRNAACVEDEGHAERCRFGSHQEGRAKQGRQGDAGPTPAAKRIGSAEIQNGDDRLDELHGTEENERDEGRRWQSVWCLWAVRGAVHPAGLRRQRTFPASLWE